MRWIVAVGVIIVAGCAGYLLGVDDAPTATEAQQARVAAKTEASREAYAKARSGAVAVGRREGRAAGRRQGRRLGATRGRRAGAEALAQAQQETAAAAAAAAPTLVPCVLGSGLCTPEENQREADIESYCGGWDPSRVQPDGSYLPKPGC